MQQTRGAAITRTTRETDIALTLHLDGGAVEIETGIGFLDHMLTALAVHAGFGLTVRAKGDLVVDGHHTIEDVGIVLGQALGQALGDKAGIERYGSALIPMDEALARAVVDISGRPYLVFWAEFRNPLIGSFPTDMVEEFFRAVAMQAGITLHLALLDGENDHHRAEALFKAAAHALRMAVRRRSDGSVLSTKGMLEGCYH